MWSPSLFLVATINLSWLIGGIETVYGIVERPVISSLAFPFTKATKLQQSNFLSIISNMCGLLTCESLKRQQLRSLSRLMRPKTKASMSWPLLSHHYTFEEDTSHPERVLLSSRQELSANTGLGLG